MRHGSLFSGIGGFDLAAEWMGWENVFHCEWNEFGQKVLKHYWPNAESFLDITKTDFTKYEGTIDIISGGFPCQPYSTAGKRKGKNDERHLWPEMLRAIREIKPRFVVGENVRGLLSWDGGLVFDEVCAELEAIGYQVAPVIIPACAVNAPHKRERIFFVAYSNSARLQKARTEQQTTGIEQHRKLDWNATNSDCGGLEGAKEIRRNSVNVEWESQFGFVTNPNGNGFDQRNGNDEINPSEGRINAQCKIESIYNEEPIIEHPNGIGQERRMHKDEPKTTIGKQFGERNARSIGTPTWDNFPTQSPICSGDDGIPSELDGITFSKWRNESIKGYGNAIVPQVAVAIFKAIIKTAP